MECKRVLQYRLILKVSVDLVTASVSAFEYVPCAQCKVHPEETHIAPRETRGPGGFLPPSYRGQAGNVNK